jgi:hypothetical protein
MHAVIALVVLLHNYALSRKLEHRLVWKAPRSMTKYCFLFARHAVPACWFLLFLSLSGFVGLVFPDAVSMMLLGHLNSY